MSTLAEIRAKLQAQENRSQQNQEKSQSDGAVYPFWNMAEGSSATVRFLPDGDKTNSFFWVERSLIKLPFAGVKGQNENKEVTVQVPCMEMYGDNCPILSEVRTWYKDESLKETANKYWKKRTYLFQGFVRSNPMSDDKTPENPIRRFIVSPQLIPVIKAGLMDPEIEEIPTDYLRGLDFYIKKARKGEYADYSTSNWARKESALTEVEQAAIEAHGLSGLREFLPKKPSEAEARIIREMFEASIDGRPYDPSKWSAYYKPWGLQTAGSVTRDEGDEEPTRQPARTASTTKPSTTSRVVDEDDSPPWEEPVTPKEVKVTQTSTVSNDKAQDILAMIRSRQNKSA